MRLVYLKEQRPYSVEELVATTRRQLANRQQGFAADQPDWVNEAFVRRFADKMAKARPSSVKWRQGTDVCVFHYIGLFDFVDEAKNDGSRRNVTYYFAPKFIDVQPRDIRPGEIMGNLEDDASRLAKGRDAVLLSIDRWNREESCLGCQTEHDDRLRESLLELAVRFLRDYLEKGLYVIRRHELEHNGRGEINWEVTVPGCQPFIDKEDPYYMDYETDQTVSDEDDYITRLQKCLVTVWGRKLEDLDLAVVLRVNVPALSEEELSRFGDADFQVSQIMKELGAQFVTRSRETLLLMKSLIEGMSETQTIDYESLSFGMTGAEHLWEAACAKVFGSELDEKIVDCGLEHLPAGVENQATFRSYMPRVRWIRQVGLAGHLDEAEGRDDDPDSALAKSWRLDFLKTCRDAQGRVCRLVIFDAKYYYASWSEAGNRIERQPGTPDVAKQIFYEMTFWDLIEANPMEGGHRISFLNAFLIPADDHDDEHGIRNPVMEEFVGWNRRIRAFDGVNLRAIRVPGLGLLRRYGNWRDKDEEWCRLVCGV